MNIVLRLYHIFNFFRWHEIVSYIESDIPVELSDEKLKKAVETKEIQLGDEIDSKRKKKVKFEVGSQMEAFYPAGLLWQSMRKQGRVYCSGQEFNGPDGIVYPHALVTVTYKIMYMVRQDFVSNTHVPMTYDDGSCSLPKEKSSTFCHNKFTGIHHYVLRDVSKTSTICGEKNMVPTRKSILVGEQLTKEKISYFISHKEKLLFKIEETIDMCNCNFVYKTNYNGLYLLDNNRCSTLPVIIVPPPGSINLEHQENIKLDYLDFKSDNTSRFLYKHNSQKIEYLSSKLIQRIIEIYNQFPNNKLIRIHSDFFGQIRGEILSVMKCDKKKLKVLKERTRCTEELEVLDDKGETYFLTPGSRLITQEFQICDCESEPFGNIFICQNYKNAPVNIIQNLRLSVSYENISQLHEIDPPGENKLELENQLLRSSFSDSGIWDPEYIKARNSYMMRGPRYKAIISGIRGTLVPDSSDWKEAVDKSFNFLDYLDYDELISLLFVNSGLKWFMDILTYIATLKFLLIDLLYNIFWKLLIGNKYRKLATIRRNMRLLKDERADEWLSAVTMPQRRRQANFYFCNENPRTTEF